MYQPLGIFGELACCFPSHFFLVSACTCVYTNTYVYVCLCTYKMKFRVSSFTGLLGPLLHKCSKFLTLPTPITLTISTTNVRPKLLFIQKPSFRHQSEFLHIYRPTVFPGQDLSPHDVSGGEDVFHTCQGGRVHTQGVSAQHLMSGVFLLIEALVGSPISVYIAHQHDTCLVPVNAIKIQGVLRKSGQCITNFNCSQTMCE